MARVRVPPESLVSRLTFHETPWKKNEGGNSPALKDPRKYESIELGSSYVSLSIVEQTIHVLLAR
jgi:hypothetical protein